MTDVATAPWWKTTWPLKARQIREFGLAFMAVVAVGTVIGAVLTKWTAPNPVTRLDVRIAESFEASRTPTGNELAHWGAFLSDTPVKIAASALVVAIMLRRWRRWHDAALVAIALIFEASAFISITFLVQRPRPDVDRLLSSPVNSSFPSGHVAAATVYLALAVVLFWHTRLRWARVLGVIGLGAIPVIVALARMYQGMHFLSDVIAGAVLGLTSLWISVKILGRPDPPRAGPASNLRADLVTTEVDVDASTWFEGLHPAYPQPTFDITELKTQREVSNKP